MLLQWLSAPQGTLMAIPAYWWPIQHNPLFQVTPVLNYNLWIHIKHITHLTHICIFNWITDFQPRLQHNFWPHFAKWTLDYHAVTGWIMMLTICMYDFYFITLVVSDYSQKKINKYLTPSVSVIFYSIWNNKLIN